MKRLIFSIISIAFSLATFAGDALPRSASKALDSLDVYVKKNDDYAIKAQSKIDEMIAKLGRRNESDLDLYEEIGRAYRYVNVDSALSFLKRGADLAARHGDRVRIDRFNILIASYLPLRGTILDALDLYNGVDRSQLSDDDRVFFYKSGHLMYRFACDFYKPGKMKERMIAEADAALDSLIRVIKPTDKQYAFYRAQYELDHGREADAIAELVASLKQIDFLDFDFARTAATIGQYYLEQPGREDDAIYYFAIAAMSDIATGNKETTALHRLGKLIYERGDLERAYNYLMLSLANAAESGSRIRSLEVAEAIPMVIEATSQDNKKHRHTLMIINICLGALLIIIGILLINAYYRNKKMLKLQRRIIVMNELKDEYIRKILTLCSVYLTALENFNTVAGRKIKAGQVQDLYYMIESGRILHEQLGLFYEVFDSAFLMVYPKFVQNVNKLLAPDKQIRLEKPGHFNPETRILAFMRLGIDDTVQISKFLGLSVNTVYTYRNKLKSKAVDRDNFEENVKKIAG
jgi:hypothetical protein